MRAFTYERPQDALAASVAALQPDARFIAGGTNLIDLMQAGIEQPAHLVDISRLALTEIDDVSGGGLRIGALATNTDVAADRRVRTRYPLLSLALVNGASAQLTTAAGSIW